MFHHLPSDNLNSNTIHNKPPCSPVWRILCEVGSETMGIKYRSVSLYSRLLLTE